MSDKIFIEDSICKQANGNFVRVPSVLDVKISNEHVRVLLEFEKRIRELEKAVMIYLILVDDHLDLKSYRQTPRFQFMPQRDLSDTIYFEWFLKL